MGARPGSDLKEVQTAISFRVSTAIGLLLCIASDQGTVAILASSDRNDCRLGITGGQVANLNASHCARAQRDG